MNERVLSALNDQVRMEMMAFYTYLSMSAWLEANDWPCLLYTSDAADE